MSVDTEFLSYAGGRSTALNSFARILLLFLGDFNSFIGQFADLPASRHRLNHRYNVHSMMPVSTNGFDWFPLWLSLRVASLATLFVLTGGTYLAYLLSHKNFRGKNLIDSLTTLPLVLPPTVLGYYLLVLIGRTSPVGRLYEGLFGQPLVFTWQAAVVAAILHSAPIYVKAARAVLEGIDRRYEWAAYGLGASEWRTFSQVTLPLARPGLTSLAALSFARSLGDFGVTIMVAGNIPGQTQTLSVAIYDAVESGNGQMARVLVLWVSVVALVLLWSANYFSRSSRISTAG